MQSDAGRKGKTGCESGTQKQRGFFGQTCATGCGSNPFAGYGLPQLERKFQSSNGRDPAGDQTQCGRRHLGQEFRKIVSFSPILLLLPSPSLPVFLDTSIIYLSIYQSIYSSIYLYIYLRVSSKMLYVRFPRSRTPRSATAPQPLQRTPY